VFRRQEHKPAIVWRGREYTYAELLGSIERRRGWLRSQPGFREGMVVSLEADYSPDAVATLLALVEANAIIVPLTESVQTKKPQFRRTAQVEAVVTERSFTPTEERATHELLRRLADVPEPGLVLFSSGSTGESKAALHRFGPILEKFKLPRHAKRMLSFLLFDHIGGINTMLYVLSNGGCMVTVEDRGPDAVCAAIERWKVQVLPTSPTFLNLLLLSEAWRGRDLASLELVTYGTEMMPESTLRRLHTLFPKVELLQTYGLSEVGILRSKSRAPDSLWIRIGGEGFATRVVDGMLEIKADSAMLGYLNAPSPFTADGWFMTKDMVEVDGDYVRFLGRRSEIINVGGEKVYPAEVEDVLLGMEGVEQVLVRGEKSAITGSMVAAVVRLSTGESAAQFRGRMREFCAGKLAPFKIPQKVTLSAEPLHNARFKKVGAQRS
jgi:acyl-coenzyme A synthetase/AMP-(fatty) acid ligase